MPSCSRHEEDLALLAGGDLPAQADAQLRLHLETCSPCQALLVDLTADQGVMVRVARTEEVQAAAATPLTVSVLARLATEAHEEAVRRLSSGVGRTRRQLGLGAFGRAAAVVAVVVSASLLGVSTLQLGGAAGPEGGRVAGPEGGRVAGPEGGIEAAGGDASQTPLGLRVHRASAGVELTWAGDGRELGRDGSVGTYSVRASADPRHFEGAAPVKVAGRQLVADLPLPASRAADRKLTYFRLE